MIFVDTSAWFALTVPSDPRDNAAREWYARNRRPLLTTDYVIDETLTLIQARGERTRARIWGRRVFAGEICRVHYLSPDEIHAAWEVFRRFSDKGWSFTDCTSKVVIEKLGVTAAFALDEHFRQFGSTPVVP